VSRPKAPGILYASALAVVMVVLALQLVSAPQDSPPAIAEIAPSAVEQIKTPPPEQATNLGRPGEMGEGGVGSDGEPPPPLTTTTVLSHDPPKEVPSVRRCVGNPPRQIEDPQSPPCVPFFQGDNGGATWRGVTKDEITIAVPTLSPAQAAPFEAFFNRRFEFYGRRLKFVDYSGKGNSCEPAVQQQAAIEAATVTKAFASSWLFSCFGQHYADELARQGVIYSTISPMYTDQALRERAPFVWQYPMALDRILTTTGRWVCAKLANRPARFTTDPLLINKPRTFGVLLLHPQFGSKRADIDIVVKEIESCGGVVVYKDAAEDSFDQTNHVLTLKQAGVTTVLCLCEPFTLTALTNSAQANAYSPEWVVNTYRENDNNINLQVGVSKAQAESLFGVSVKPRQSKIENEPAYWAISESDPTYGSGTSKPTGLDQKDRNEAYRSLLLLASGIQLAGPNLTPKTFEQGLQRATFPNPETSINAGKVGFAGGSHSMTIDATDFWWSNRDDGPYADKGTGTMCYVEDGKRRTESTWPRGDDLLFARPCHAGA
jgi:hypothetical protein